MRVSFVIPAYNEEKNIAACLEAIRREIAREACDAEIVVVDNASTDGTREAALRHEGVRVVHEPRKGLVRARQAGFNATQGELVANIDADTRLTEGWLAKVLREFGRDARLVALSGPFIYHDLSAFDRALVKLFYGFGYLSYLFSRFVVRNGSMLQGGNFTIRRDAWEAAGGFDTSIEFYGEDTDVAKRLSKVGKVKWTFALPAYSSGRRLKHEGIVRTGLRYALNYFWILLFGRPATVRYRDIRPE